MFYRRINNIQKEYTQRNIRAAVVYYTCRVCIHIMLAFISCDLQSCGRLMRITHSINTIYIYDAC